MAARSPRQTRTSRSRRCSGGSSASWTGWSARCCATTWEFLGACFGIGTLGRHLGGVVDRTYGEPVGAVEITLTDEGAADPLLAGLPRSFKVSWPSRVLAAFTARYGG